MSVSVTKESKLLARHSVIYGLGDIMGRSVSLLLLPVYTRYLTPNDYGIKELVGLSTDVIGILMATAISSSIYRFYFEYKDIKDRNEVISTAIISIGCFGLFCLFLLSFATKNMAEYILNSAELYHYFLIAFASLWFNSLKSIGYNYLRANQQSLKFVIISFFGMLLAISLNLFLVCVVNLGVLGILISTLVSSIIVCAVIVIPLIFKVGLHFSLEKFKEMLKFGIPLIPSQFGAFIVHLSDRFFIKAYCSVADTGLYSLGYRFGTLSSNFISTPFCQTFLPRRYELYKQDRAEQVFGKIFTYFLYLMIFAGLGVSVLTKEVLMIVADEKFWSAYRIVPIIVLATTIFSLHNHFNMGILIHKKTKYLSYIDFSNGLIILILNYFLIRHYGVYGAAYATLIAFIYKVSLIYYFSNKYYKIHFEFTRIVKMLLVATFIFILTLQIQFDSVYLSFIIKTGVIFLFPILLFYLNFYLDEEKDKLRNFLKSKLLLVKVLVISK